MIEAAGALPNFIFCNEGIRAVRIVKREDHLIFVIATLASIKIVARMS
jgi:hypothetical protein